MAEFWCSTHQKMATDWCDQCVNTKTTRRESSTSHVETGWLIEHKDTSKGVRYLTLRYEVASFWTNDSLLALRFSRKQDADDFREYFAPIEGDMDKAVEHQWCDPAPATV